MHLSVFSSSQTVESRCVLELQTLRPGTGGDGKKHRTLQEYVCVLTSFSLALAQQVLYYHEKPVPNHEGRFKRKVEWAGDAHGRDASIVLRKVSFQFNGTFSCQVWNPPDVHGNVGQVRLRVVSTGEHARTHAQTSLLNTHMK